MIPLGILAAQFDAPVAGGSYDLLETEILTGSQASVTFSSLGDYAADYQHLQIRFAARSTRSVADDVLHIQINSITTGYAFHQLSGNGSSVSSGDGLSASSLRIGRMTDAASAANAFGVGVCDILDPFETTKNTTFRSLTGMTSSNFITLMSGFQTSTTAALTEIKLLSGTGNNLAQFSRFSLYGVKTGA